MVVVFGVLTPDTFLTSANLQNLLNQCVVPVIMACGVTFVLAVGEFDLSFGATIGLSSALLAYGVKDQGLPWPLAVIAVLVLTAALGIGLGLLVTMKGASSFIVTLAMASAFTGAELALTAGQPVYIQSPGLSALTTDRMLGVRGPVLLCLLVVVLTAVVLHGTRFGRHAQSLGGNLQAAHLAGVRVRRIKVACFTLTAFLAGLGALVLTSRSSSYFPNTAGNLVLGTYAAIFLGATVGRSGRFLVLGSVLGVVWIIVLQTGLTLNNAPTWSAILIQGVVLAVAVLVGSRARAQ
jgi:ribose/xylose/arabinose/galactoside ABC-type transport system permease subunit